MKQILITGSVTNEGSNRIRLYTKLVETCHGFAEHVYSPLDTMKFQGSDKERYQRAITLISTSNLVIAEVSTPSTGQGMELQEACRHNIPVIALAEDNSKVSGLVLGLPSLLSVIYYSDPVTLLAALISVLEKQIS